MTGQTTIPMIFAIAIPNMALWAFLDRQLKRRTQEIALGIVNGHPLAQRDRRLMFHTSWAKSWASVTFSQSIFTLGYWLLSLDAATPNAKWFAQLYAFFSLAGALSHLAYGPLWFVRLYGLLYPKRSDSP